MDVSLKAPATAEHASRVIAVALAHYLVDVPYTSFMGVKTVGTPLLNVIATGASYLAIAFAITAPDPAQPWRAKAWYNAVLVWPLCWWVFNAIVLVVRPLHEAGWAGREPFKRNPTLAALTDMVWGLVATQTLAYADHALFRRMIRV